ncbi:MAG: hypothetical protein KC464_24330 [Myxococcales bacterium]|nr:hypothetical protein [Myxococcales bacterium]
MTEPVTYPTLVPPPGWNRHVVGTQLRYLPPGTTPATARVAIVVSPRIPRLPRLPAPATLITQTLDAERARAGFTVVAQSAPREVHTATGLTGVEVTARLRMGDGVERRIYDLFEGPTCYQGISYLAAEGEHDVHEAAFRAAAATIEPAPASGDVSALAHWTE